MRSIIDTGIKKLVISDEFWDRVAKIHRLLQPVAKGILLLESDVSQIGFVCRLFNELQQHIQEYSEGISLIEKNQLLKVVASRKDFSTQPIHYLANLLDQRYLGDSLSVEEEALAVDLLSTLAIQFGISEIEVMMEFAKFNPKSGVWASESKWISAAKLDT